MPSDPISELEKRVKAVFRALPKQVGREVVNFTLENWHRQGFLGATLQPWQPRRTVTKKNKGNAILVGTGRLYRSIRILRSDDESVVVGSDLPYAKVHNEGFNGTVQVKAHTRGKFGKEKITGSNLQTKKVWTRTVKKEVGRGDVKAHESKMNIHKRQFLGDSPYLDANIKRLIALQIMKAART